MTIHDPLFEYKNKTLSDASLEDLKQDLLTIDSRLTLYYQLNLDKTCTVGVLNCQCPEHFNAIKDKVEQYMSNAKYSEESVTLEYLIEVLKTKGNLK